MSTKITPPVFELPGFRSVSVPEKYRDHGLLQGPPFFTVPRRLLELVEKEVGADRFDRELLEMEYALSDICGDHSSRIGFWGGTPVSFVLLREIQLQVEQDYLTAWAHSEGKSAEELQSSLGFATSRLGRFRTIQRGYLGWLMTNADFLKEHAKIFKRWKTDVAQHGVPIMGPVVHDARLVPGAVKATATTAKFLAEFEDFFTRWRLQGMPAPFAPQPLAPQMPVVDLRPVLSHMKDGGTTFYMPDIFPVPGRDELRDMIEDSLRPGAAPAQLAGWFDIVRSDNPSRGQISKYARVWEVQHYMRSLCRRHANAMRRKLSALKSAVADFLSVDGDTIDNDVKLVASRLHCSDWYLETA